MPTAETSFDVIVIGAGISGLAAAHYLRKLCPTKSFVLLERRERLGGTWDLFKYPGFRTDSDMCTFGFSFKPWRGKRGTGVAGRDVNRYLNDMATEENVRRNIRCGVNAKRAHWSTSEARWDVTCVVGEEEVHFSSRFLCGAAGYYDPRKGFTPDFAGLDTFQGSIAHPHVWPTELEIAGKRVAMIGSGATAVTMAPALVEAGAAKVTMVQRSPSFIMPCASTNAATVGPWNDVLSWVLRGPFASLFGPSLAHKLVRLHKNCYDAAFYALCMWFPRFLTTVSLAIIWIYGSVHAGWPLPLRSFRRDFVPSYHMWTQRVCLSPDGDFYAALGTGTLNVVTSAVESITPRGIQLTSGEHVDADIIVTATGFHLSTFGFTDLEFAVDGEHYPVSVNGRGRLTYKGVTTDRLPNCVAIVGYTNQSWTLKAELIASYLCRLVNYMDQHGYSKVQAVPSKEVVENATQYFPLQSGYLSRSKHLLPLQGPQAPWCATQNYLLDLWRLWLAPLDDGHLVFERPTSGS